jgi:hypothetical protein
LLHIGFHVYVCIHAGSVILVSSDKLLEVHAAPHPARPGRARRDAGELGGAKAASADERARSSLLAALDAEGEDDELDGAGGADRRGTPHPLAASPGQGARWQDASMQSHSRRAVARDLHYLCQQRAGIEIQYWRGLTGTLGGAYGVVAFTGVKDARRASSLPTL